MVPDKRVHLRRVCTRAPKESSRLAPTRYLARKSRVRVMNFLARAKSGSKFHNSTRPGEPIYIAVQCRSDQINFLFNLKIFPKMTDNRNDVSENENEANDVFYNQSQVVTTAEKKKRA